MLVLSRKETETIHSTCRCGCQTTMVVSSINGNRVAIGIEAPKEVRIVRGELKPDQQWPLPGTKLEGKPDAA